MVTGVRSGLVNGRDVGGLTVEGGGRTRHGVLLRSDAPFAGDPVPPRLSWPPVTVVDLRSPAEAASVHPLDRPGTTVHRLPLIADADPVRLAAGPGGLSLAALYADMLNGAGGRVAQAVELAAVGPAPCLVHCAAGKDRTGVVVAVALAAVGVERAAIVADYVQTAENMPAVLDRIVRSRPETERAAARQRVADVPGDLFDSPPAAIEGVLDTLAGHVGGAAGWLVAQGLRPATLGCLRERLITSRP